MNKYDIMNRILASTKPWRYEAAEVVDRGLNAEPGIAYGALFVNEFTGDFDIRACADRDQGERTAAWVENHCNGYAIVMEFRDDQPQPVA